MEFNIKVVFSLRDFELMVDTIRDKIKSEEVINDPNRLCEYMNIYDKVSSVATLLKISEYEKATKMSDDEEEEEI